MRSAVSNSSQASACDSNTPRDLVPPFSRSLPSPTTDVVAAAAPFGPVSSLAVPCLAPPSLSLRAVASSRRAFANLDLRKRMFCTEPTSYLTPLPRTGAWTGAHARVHAHAAVSDHAQTSEGPTPSAPLSSRRRVGPLPDRGNFSGVIFSHNTRTGSVHRLKNAHSRIWAGKSIPAPD